MKRQYRALLVDDERPARRWLGELLLAHPEIEIIGEADSVDTAVVLARDQHPDIIFLDVQMPPGTGFDVLPALPSTSRVVFVTAYDTFAVKAFEANALDYLMKPVHPDRLVETLRRLELATSDSSIPPQKPLEQDDLLPLRDRGIFRMVPIRALAAVEAEAAYSRVLIRQQDPMLILRSMKEWEDQLPGGHFHRIDRSLILQTALVEKVEARNRNEALVFLKDIPAPLVLGRVALTRLRKLMTG
jgi:two-component system LytT family response regulator